MHVQDESVLLDRGIQRCLLAPGFQWSRAQHQSPGLEDPSSGDGSWQPLLTVPLVSGVSSVTPTKSIPLDELPVSSGISVILWLLPRGLSPRGALLSPSQNPGPVAQVLAVHPQPEPQLLHHFLDAASSPRSGAPLARW